MTFFASGLRTLTGLSVLATLLACPPKPALDAPLVGYEWVEPGPEGGWPTYATRGYRPAWRLPSEVEAERLQVVLTSTTGRTVRPPVDAEDADALETRPEDDSPFTIARTGTVAPGSYTARLSLDGVVVARGRLRVRRVPAGLGADAWARLRRNPQPWLRFCGYLQGGRQLWGTSSEAARRMWSEGAADAVLRTNFAAGAQYLSSSALFLELHADRYDLARTRLQSMETESASPSASPRLGLLVEFYRAMFEERTGRRLDALERFRRVSLDAQRWGFRPLATTSRLNYVTQLGLLGRVRRARRAAEALQGYAERPPDRMVALDNVLWQRVRGHEMGLWTEDLLALERRYARMAVSDGTSPPSLSNVFHVRAAYLALRRGDVEAAGRRLGAVRGWEGADLNREPTLLRSVRAEYLWRRGRREAAREELELVLARRSSATLDDARARVLPLTLLGQVLEELGDLDAARAAREEAWQEELRSLRSLDPLAVGQYLYLRRTLPGDLARARAQASPRRLEAAAAVLEEALYEGWAQMRFTSAAFADRPAYQAYEDADHAARVHRLTGCAHLPPKARTSCHAAQRDLDERREVALLALFSTLQAPRLERPAASLRALREKLGAEEGVLLSGASRDGVQAFLLTSKSIFAAGGAGALETLAPHLSRLSRLRVSGPLDPSEALAPGGELPWAARLSIVRRPSGAWRGAAVPSGGDPVVVANPTGDLPDSDRHGRALAAAFGVPVRLHAAATRASIIGPLSEAHRPRLFVFSGHGEMVGPDASTTRLRLADGDLTVQDVLTHGLSAKLVVLNGCTTGGAATGYGVGLPEAFLLQGSDAVLATIRPVEDAAGRAFVDRFLAERAETDPEAAFLATVRWSRGTEAQAWRHYRLWRR